MAEEGYKIDNISKKFSKKELYFHQSIHIKKNCTNVLIGRNGSGKTTLMKIFAGKSSSDTKILGLPNNIMILENTAFFIKSLSGLSNIQFALFSNGSHKSTREIIIAANEFFIDEDTMKSPIYNYSLGTIEKLKFVLLRLSRRIDLFLIDEPFTSLDDQSYKIISDWLKKSKKTILLSTHSKQIRDDLISGYLISLENKKFKIVKEK